MINDDIFYAFVDIDGVLATQFSMKTEKRDILKVYSFYGFDKDAVKIFNRFLNKYKPLLIITACMRKIKSIEQIKVLFNNEGIVYPIHDVTSCEYSRGKEILTYIEKHKVSNFVVIDDEMTDISPYIPSKNIIHTSDGLLRNGIEEKHIKIWESRNNLK